MTKLLQAPLKLLGHISFSLSVDRCIQIRCLGAQFHCF